MIPDSLSPGIVIRAPDKTTARESGDEANFYDRVSTNTYCLVKILRFSRRSENSVERVTYEREAPTDTLQLDICSDVIKLPYLTRVMPDQCKYASVLPVNEVL